MRRASEPAGPVRRRALLIAVVLLVAAGAALGGAAALGWARVGFQVPLRGTVLVQVNGSDVQPALGALALLALAAVAAVAATGGWARRLLGALLLAVAVAPVLGVLRVADEGRLTAAVAGLPARAVPDGTVTVLPAGPVLAALGALLLAGAGAALVLQGHRMPRMGRRYRAPTARHAGPPDREPPGQQPPGQQPLDQQVPDHELWERIDAGEDPTAPSDPR